MSIILPNNRSSCQTWYCSFSSEVYWRTAFPLQYVVELAGRAEGNTLKLFSVFSFRLPAQYNFLDVKSECIILTFKTVNSAVSFIKEILLILILSQSPSLSTAILLYASIQITVSFIRCLLLTSRLIQYYKWLYNHLNTFTATSFGCNWEELR